jgi:hypothetical protein
LNTVYKYSKKFNYLAQYGAHHVDTDEIKAVQFRKGLSAQPQLHERLVLFYDLTFTTLVSAVIDEEGASRVCVTSQNFHFRM